MDREPLIACEHCASVYRRHALQPGESAICARCGTVLWRYSRLTLSSWLALTLAAVIVFVVANAYPVATLTVTGTTRSATLLDAVFITWQHGRRMVSLMTGLAGFGLPLLQLFVLLWVLGPLARGVRPVGFAPAMRVLGLLRPWCMVPVFVLGVLVSVVKLVGLASVTLGVGLGGFAALTVLLTMLSCLSPPTIWRYAEENGVARVHVLRRQAGQVLTGCHACGQVQALPAGDATAPHRCVRCDAVVHYRKPDHLARTWALLAAAAMLYIPANILPIMHVRSLLGNSGHTILGGVVELWVGGSWDIALIVFVASVVVPLTKLLALALLAGAVQWGSKLSARQCTRLYEMVEIIGQWSMLDVFVVILLAALAHFQGLMEISAGTGAGAFGLVVILTMLSAMSFDPRRGWDRELREGRPAAAPAAVASPGSA